MKIELLENVLVRTGYTRHLRLKAEGKEIIAVYHFMRDNIADSTNEDVEVINGKGWSKPDRKKIEKFISNELKTVDKTTK